MGGLEFSYIIKGGLEGKKGLATTGLKVFACKENTATLTGACNKYTINVLSVVANLF